MLELTHAALSFAHLLRSWSLSSLSFGFELSGRPNIPSNKSSSSMTVSVGTTLHRDELVCHHDSQVVSKG
jgi:hypothetical protein